MKYLCTLCIQFLRKSLSAHKNASSFSRFSFGRLYSSEPPSSGRQTYTDLSQYPVERIRNFSIIAHIDHGKSTLADRLLEITDTIPKVKSNKQVLDKLQVERERGITVKAQTASLFYHYKGEEYLLNLIDTPGHVDFNYEVSRSLAACQGVILLIDANQGVQAQTVANYYLAFESNLVIIPVLNKIDLKGAQPDLVKQQIKAVFAIHPQHVHMISAKEGTGVEELLKTVIDTIPPPIGIRNSAARALLFDSKYDVYRGVIGYFSLIDGVLKKGDKISSFHNKKSYEIQEVGFMHPVEEPTNSLYAGQVGYMICNMRNAKEAQVGDTYYLQNTQVEPLPGFKPAKPMVFAGVYPSDQSEFSSLRSAVERLTLNDASVSVHQDSSPALGQGFRLGFLGLLHMDVFSQRLEQEHNASVITTCPNVPYKVKIKGAKNIKKYTTDEITILNPCHLPDTGIITEMSEPVVNGTILMPDDYLGDVMTLCLERRGLMSDQNYLDNKRIMIKVRLPLNEILVDFYDELKSLTSGYASFDYEDAGYEISNLVKVDFLINSRPVEELSLICHTTRARQIAKNICSKLTESIRPQLFMIAIQGAVGGQIIARENIKALRKDVLAKCYGGDITRKEKLLRRQAEGKKKMRKIGNVEIPKDAFIKALKR